MHWAEGLGENLQACVVCSCEKKRCSEGEKEGEDRARAARFGPAHHHGGVDALAGERVNVPRGVADDDQVVVVGTGNALGAQAQRGRLHALHLGAGPHRARDEGVALQRALVQPLQVRLLRMRPRVQIKSGDGEQESLPGQASAHAQYTLLHTEHSQQLPLCLLCLHRPLPLYSPYSSQALHA